MNDLTKKLSDSLHPFMAIIAYKAEQSEDYYIEQRRINRNGKMSSGAPLKEKTICQLMKTVAVNSEELDAGLCGIIPPNLLYCDTRIGNTKLVWYRPPEVRNVCFAKQVGIPDGQMHVPGLVYVVRGDRLAVYAFKGRRPKSKLYHAPFMNVDEKYVCLGSAKSKKPENPTFSDMISYWEGLFWQSEFSHILGSNPIDGNLASITKTCIETGCEFPTECLISVNIKLKDLLK